MGAATACSIIRRATTIVTMTMALAGCGDLGSPPVGANKRTEARRNACLERIGDTKRRYLPVARTMCAELANLQGVGATIAIFENGKPALKLGIGHGCTGDSLANKPDTLFRLGSITKAYTSALAVRLAETGALDLDAPISDHIPELRLATGPSAITLRQVLTHTAGLPDVLPTATTGRLDASGWIRTLATVKPIASPGDRWSYANTGYYLAGLTIERVGRGPFSQLLARHVLVPSELRHTAVEPHEALGLGAACGHIESERGPTMHSVDRDFSMLNHGARWSLPAGGVMASAEDLARFVLTNGNAIAELDGGAAETGRGDRYGFGLRWQALPDGRKLVYHAGNTSDFAADLYWVPDDGFVVVVLSNTGEHFRATAHAALMLADAQGFRRP